jgi:hypothetical protein
MAVDEKVAVHDIDTTSLTARLFNQRAVLEWKRQETNRETQQRSTADR